MATPTGNVLTAADVFGSDAESVDKFKTIALRALYDQKVEDELKSTRVDNQKLQKENAALAMQVNQLTDSMDANIDDRERVLAFKSKRIEELQVKVKDYEAINASLLQTINGLGPSESGEAGRNTPASVMLLQRGQPLFHAVETCKEQDYKRLLEEKMAFCDHLQRQITENEALVSEMQQFQREKGDYLAQIQELGEVFAKLSAEKEEKLHFLERKLVFEQDRLTKEKHSEIAAHQSDMEKQLAIQLDVTTQHTIEENTRVQLELRYQSTQVEKLIKQVDTLQATSRQVSHEKQMLEEMNAKLSKKIKFYEQLFAKMQQKEQSVYKNHQQNISMQYDDPGFSTTGGSPRSVSSVRRKPPLPSLALSTGGVHMRSAFALSTASPPRSPSCRNEEVESPVLLDMDALDLLGDQLNSVASEFDFHLQKREFARKEVHAMLQYHNSSTAASSSSRGFTVDHKVKKKNIMRKVMLPKNDYSPASYASRGARRLREQPLTLDAFIHEHAIISPRNRTVRTHREPSPPTISMATAPSPRLPALGPSSVLGGAAPHRPPHPRSDASVLWKTTATDQGEENQQEKQIQTARF